MCIVLTICLGACDEENTGVSNRDAMELVVAWFKFLALVIKCMSYREFYVQRTIDVSVQSDVSHIDNVTTDVISNL